MLQHQGTLCGKKGCVCLHVNTDIIQQIQELCGFYEFYFEFFLHLFNLNLSGDDYLRCRKAQKNKIQEQVNVCKNEN